MAEETRDAMISADGLYRYRLTRWWDTTLDPVTFVMLNPSTADGLQDDPTIGRCRGFARDWGYGGLVVVNLFGYRATKPEAMWAYRDYGGDIVGPENDLHLSDAAEHAAAAGAPLIAAWGAATKARSRVEHVLTLPGMDRLRTLHVNVDGSPKHPLYVRASAIPMPWSLR